jgi:regulator of nucleoside diphosphate kinase
MKTTCQLTTKDHAILETMLERHAATGDTIVPMLRRKLASARVVFSDEIDPGVVTLNSRVTFSVDGGTADTRIVVQGTLRGFVGLTIPITVPRGLALLGLSAGEEAVIDCVGGPTETLLVEEVLFQPEAVRHGRRQRPIVPIAPQRPFPVLVYSNSACEPLGDGRKIRHTSPNGDDPGPSAA